VTLVNWLPRPHALAMVVLPYIADVCCYWGGSHAVVTCGSEGTTMLVWDTAALLLAQRHVCHPTSRCVTVSDLLKCCNGSVVKLPSFSGAVLEEPTLVAKSLPFSVKDVTACAIHRDTIAFSVKVRPPCS
jgi:hypothetical protein